MKKLEMTKFEITYLANDLLKTVVIEGSGFRASESGNLAVTDGDGEVSAAFNRHVSITEVDECTCYKHSPARGSGSVSSDGVKWL